MGGGRTGMYANGLWLLQMVPVVEGVPCMEPGCQEQSKSRCCRQDAGLLSGFDRHFSPLDRTKVLWLCMQVGQTLPLG